MSAIRNPSQKLSHTDLLTCLNDRQRRRLLRLLDDEPEPKSERELAERLAAIDGSRPVAEIPEVTIEGVQIQLRHVHLPRLDDACLLEWDRDDQTVVPPEELAYDEETYRRLIEMDDEDWDDIVDTTVDGRLRNVLSALSASGDGVRRDVLAHKVAAREADGESWTDALEDVRTELHHLYLPKLASTGLIDYDVDSGTVTYQGHPSDESWERKR
jgi:DNA-binding transcriptional ArsR family regulator